MGDVKATMIACYLRTVNPTSTVRYSLIAERCSSRIRFAVAVSSFDSVQGDIAAAEATLAELKKQPLYTISTLKVRSRVQSVAASATPQFLAAARARPCKGLPVVQCHRCLDGLDRNSVEVAAHKSTCDVQVVEDSSVDAAVRVAAALNFKNVVKTSWVCSHPCLQC